MQQVGLHVVIICQIMPQRYPDECDGRAPLVHFGPFSSPRPALWYLAEHDPLGADFAAWTNRRSETGEAAIESAQREDANVYLKFSWKGRV